MTEKVIGYTLLILGLGIILFSALNVYRVFTKQTEAVKIFSAEKTATSTKISGSAIPMGPELLGLAPDTLNSSLNFTFHLLFMGFIAGIGYKLASLGVSLIRPSVVKLDTKKLQEIEKTS